MGLWCYLTNQPPSVFNELTRVERKAFEDAAVDAKKKGW